MKTLINLYIIILGISLSGCAQEKEKNLVEKGVYQNRLSNASSPYLQGHADNPVDWYEWGEEALKKAKEEDKPIIISIGYAACHWCHVMERETFMDTTVAKIMNENFISIKIDREERPDIDQVYMNAATLISGRGGWPLNAFTLPNGKPFYAGTYFPTEEWKDILNQIANTYENEPERLVEAANSVTEGVKQQDIIDTPLENKALFAKEDYVELWQTWKPLLDLEKGGFKRAPKFPLPIGYDFLLQYSSITGNEEAMEAVESTLREMARGGIYDQLGGGFSRYSVDEDWFVPHFEKMLYDNAQLVSLYSKAFKKTKDEEYEEVVRETLEFIERELAAENGGFYSSLNADSEGEEGKFYIWQKNEIEEHLSPKEAEIFTEFYGVESKGNWEDNKNILFRENIEPVFAQLNDYCYSSFLEKLKSAEGKMMEVRNSRIRPSTDDKILTSWNSLMIIGYLDAYTALGEEKYKSKAKEALRFIENNLIQENGGLFRNFKDGKPSINAFLDDYAFLASAYMRMYEVTLDKKWLVKSKKLVDYSRSKFLNKKSGMFYYTSEASEELIARKMEITDNVIPASNSEMATVLFKLGNYFQKEEYLVHSEQILAQVKERSLQGGPYYANWTKLMGMLVFSPFEIATMGKDAVKVNLELQKKYIPISLFMGGEQEDLPLLEAKLVENETYIYVCRNRTCKLPVKRADKAFQQINDFLKGDEKSKSFWE
ncbi:thioredoxin domain-containing protein [Salegentibacter sp. JZCK2]|uniref:thioredoxin domain-containing protein n=1 Tax=Salegentibacter tibetensis TaxID=2873600 RepID=UPI001CCA87DD|nr:thioredoxin domain-containing protein [Salegentibacter tibetensis]MBZ9730864.1 thioredoxin domain-containing protein [Salegentibacter tibetensis]